MRKKIFKISLAFCLLASLVSFALAQRQTGSIAGKIVDNEGIPLPGVSVTLSGPAMMGTQAYITTESGDFRFPALPPGRDYVLTAEMAGFQKVMRGEIIVSVGKTVSLVIELKPTTLTEEVTVTAPSPTVDVTSSKRSVTYTSDLINNIPLARDYQQIVLTAPGVVDVGGGRVISSGADMRNSQVALDGVVITNRAQGSPQIQMSFDIFEEFELELGAHQAEVGMTPGSYVNIVTKSGGNAFHGSALAYYFNQDMARSLIPGEEATAVGLTKPTGLKSYYDYSATLGGPIIKDKLWFFVNGRLFNSTERAESIVDGVYDSSTDEIHAFGKLTFQLRPNLKFTGMASFRNWSRPFQAGGYYVSKYSNFYIKNSPNWVAQGMINWVLNQNTFLDIRLQYQRQLDRRHLHPDLDPAAPRYSDRFTRIVTGPPEWVYDFDIPGIQFIVTLNRFLDNFLGGNHEIKAGAEYDFSNILVPFWRGNPITVTYTYKGLPWGYHDVKPYMGYFAAGTVGEKPGDWPLDLRSRVFSAYFQDSLTLKERITLNFGLRYDESHAHVGSRTFKPVGAKSPILMMLAPNIFSEFTFPEIKNVHLWKDFSPRFGLVFDLFGDKTTSLRASWARYNDYLTLGRITRVTPEHPVRFEAYWFDLNMNGIMETTDSYQVLTLPPDPVNFDLSLYLDPNSKSPYTEEIIFGLERELFKDFSLSISYIYKEKKNMLENVEKFRGYNADSGWWVPHTVADPGFDGKYGTSDDSQITVYGVKKGAPMSRTWMTNPPEAKRKYRGLEFVFQKRMSHGWQLLGSLTLSKLEGNILDTWDGAIGYDRAFDTPNWSVNRYGRLSFDRPILIKVQGSVMLPLTFMLSGYYTYYSGAPWGRTLQVQLPNNPALFEYPGTLVETVMAEAPGTRRYHALNNLDLRVEKVFSAGKFGKLGIFLDVLNVMGEKGYTINQDPGGYIYNNGTFQRWPTFSRFTGIYGLRTYKVSARFTF